MPRIRLAAWYAGAAPGSELDVDDATLKDLTRDGLVAALVEPPVTADEPAAQAVEEPPTAAEASPDEAPAGRKRR